MHFILGEFLPAEVPVCFHRHGPPGLAMPSSVSGDLSVSLSWTEPTIDMRSRDRKPTSPLPALLVGRLLSFLPLKWHLEEAQDPSPKETPRTLERWNGV